MCEKEHKVQNEQEEPKKFNLTFDRVLNIICACGAVVALLQFFRNIEISQILFNLLIRIPIMLITFIVCIDAYKLKMAVKEYRKNIEELDNFAKLQMKARKQYGYWRNEFRKEFYDNLKKDASKKAKICGIILLVIVTVCIIFPQNADAFWNGVLGVEDEVSEEKTDIPEENKEDVDKTEESVKEERDMRWRFVLDKPAQNFTLETQIKNQVYFCSDKEYTEWVTYVQEISKQWKENQKKGVDYKTVKDGNGNGFFDYTSIEDNFKEDVFNASIYTYYDEWLVHAPHSYEYDKCIVGREALNNVEVEGTTGCYEIWWKLANDYLYYAQEYEQQTENAEAILFYYTNSIYCCIEALKYSMSEDEYNMIYHFMVMRYHDICRDECIISQVYKAAAADIYSILVKTDVLRNEGKVN